MRLFSILSVSLGVSRDIDYIIRKLRDAVVLYTNSERSAIEILLNIFRNFPDYLVTRFLCSQVLGIVMRAQEQERSAA